MCCRHQKVTIGSVDSLKELMRSESYVLEISALDNFDIVMPT